MLQAHSLAYEPDPLVGKLFEDLSLSVATGERVVLTGRNGTGKTKLMEILAGRLTPTCGSVVLRDGSTVGYLPQDFDLAFAGTLWDLLGGDDPSAHRLLARLGIVSSMLDQTYQSLSPGERTRAHLAHLMLSEPDILLLDEPTNHLDIAGRQWLERTLLGCRQGVLMVCHDRAMANAVATRMLELEGGKLHEYGGNYDDMVRAKSQMRERQTEQFERQRGEARRILAAAEDTLVRARKVAEPPTKGTYDPKHAVYYAGKAGRMDKRAAAMRTRVEQARAHQVDKPKDDKPVSLAFRAAPCRSEIPLLVRHVSKSYERPIIRDVSLTLERRGRVAITGPNGCGKTTLFRLILGQESADSGEITWSPDARPAYLSQSRGALDASLALIDALAPEDAQAETFVRTLLARLHIVRDDVYKPVGALSVGERTKAELVKMLMSEANVLVLDEPTNHLDVPSLEALESALTEFPGSVLFTHDREFVARVATEVVSLE